MDTGKTEKRQRKLGSEKQQPHHKPDGKHRYSCGNSKHYGKVDTGTHCKSAGKLGSEKQRTECCQPGCGCKAEHRHGPWCTGAGAGYAAGMGCMESTCGALIGAVMVAGIVTDGKGTPRISKELPQNFQEKCGATICKDLKGIENGAPLCPCPECVRNAVLALGEVLRRRAAKS